MPELFIASNGTDHAMLTGQLCNHCEAGCPMSDCAGNSMPCPLLYALESGAVNSVPEITTRLEAGRLVISCEQFAPCSCVRTPADQFEEGPIDPWVPDPVIHVPGQEPLL